MVMFEIHCDFCASFASNHWFDRFNHIREFLNSFNNNWFAKRCRGNYIFRRIIEPWWRFKFHDFVFVRMLEVIYRNIKTFFFQLCEKIEWWPLGLDDLFCKRLSLEKFLLNHRNEGIRSSVKIHLILETIYCWWFRWLITKWKGY